MNIPSPPTDSLYKFCALVGTLLAFASFFIPYQMAERLHEKEYNLLKEVKRAVVKQQFLKERIDHLGKIINTTVDAQKGKYRPDPNKLELGYSDEELKAFMNELEKVREDTSLEAAEFKVRLDEQDYIRKQVILITWFGAALFIISGMLAFYGYRCWYYRIQRYQDEAIRKNLAAKDHSSRNA